MSKKKVQDRLETAGIPSDRFVDVEDGDKMCVDHTEYGAEAVGGNYGVYAGRGLIIFDVDDGDELPDNFLDGVLPETLIVKSPHSGVREGHLYFRCPEDTPERLEERYGVKNPAPPWGEVQAHNKYVVGPGSQLNGCDKCDECSNPDGGRYEISEDREIAELSFEDITAILDETEDDTGGNEKVTEYTEFDVEDEQERLELALRQDDKLEALYNGRYAAAGYPDDRSKAESALAMKLAFWFGRDKNTVASLMDDADTQKWSERTDSSYRDSVLEAVDEQNEFFEPDKSHQNGHRTNGSHDDGGDASDTIPSFDVGAGYRLQLIPVSGDEARIVVRADDDTIYSETKEKGAWKSRQVRQKVASSVAEQAPEDDQGEVKGGVKSALIDAIAEEKNNPDRWKKLMRDGDTQELIERTEDVVVYPDEDGALWVVEMAPPDESPKEDSQTFELDGGQLNNNSPTPFENEYLEKFLVRTDLDPAAWKELSEYWIEEAEPKEGEVNVDKEAFIEEILDDLNSGGFTCVDWSDRFDAFDWGGRKAIYAAGNNGFEAVEEDAVLVPGTYISEKKEDVTLDWNLSKELRERGVVLTTSKRVRAGPDQQQRRVWVFDADETLFANGDNLYSPDDEPEEEVEI